MSPFPYTIEIDQSIRTADLMMKDHGIRHLPVTREGKLVGILSERDIRVAHTIWGRDRGLEVGTTVGAVCTVDPHVVDIGARLDEVVLEMAEQHIGSAVVMKGDRVAGILTTTDACRLLGELLREVHSDSAPQPA